MSRPTDGEGEGVSFTPDGDFFVFDRDTGRTLARGFRSRRQARAWIARQRTQGLSGS